MIRYVVRTAPVVAKALAARVTGGEPTRISRLERRVRLTDIDTNIHMNQAVYAQVMELGRADLLIRSGAFGRWRRDGINPVVASQRIVYRRELKRGTRYVLDTRCVGVEGRLLQLETHLVVGDRVHARGEAELIFIGRGGVLDATSARAVCGDLPTAPLPVDDWRLTDSGG